MAKSTSTLHVGTAQLVEQHVKQQQSDGISADIKAFLAKGGKIQKLGNTPLRWDGRPKAKVKKKTKGLDSAFHRVPRAVREAEETDPALA
jgi:hypothetical protein